MDAELIKEVLGTLGELDFAEEGGRCAICGRHDPKLWREFGHNCCPREKYGHRPECAVPILKKKLAELL